MDYLAELRGYRPRNEQEERDRAAMLAFAARNPDCLLRENLAGHFTASVWVVNPERTKTLMVYHNLYRSWSWIGGHADGEGDLSAVALRELAEETGVTDARLLSPRPCTLEQLFVEGHEKRGQYVPSHLHLNLTFLAEAKEGTPLRPCPGENTAVRWMTPAEVRQQVSEPWMLARVYEKLMAQYMAQPACAGEKEAVYRALTAQLAHLLEGEEDTVANLSNAAAVLYGGLPELNWAGFYLVKEGALVLGPFQGSVACVRIPFDRGVCGAAVREDRVQRVANVHAFPTHIACDSASNSEIVLPLHWNGRVVAVLDVDSPAFDRFDGTDQAGLEQCARIIEDACRWETL